MEFHVSGHDCVPNCITACTTLITISEYFFTNSIAYKTWRNVHEILKSLVPKRDLEIVEFFAAYPEQCIQLRRDFKALGRARKNPELNAKCRSEKVYSV